MLALIERYQYTLHFVVYGAVQLRTGQRAHADTCPPLKSVQNVHVSIRTRPWTNRGWPGPLWNKVSWQRQCDAGQSSPGSWHSPVLLLKCNSYLNIVADQSDLWDVLDKLDWLTSQLRGLKDKAVLAAIIITETISSIPACSIAPLMAMEPSLVAGTEDRLPLNDPIGVRVALTMTTS